MPPMRRQSAAKLPSLARYGVRAVDTGNDTQKTRGEATYTAPALRSACSPSSCKLPMSGVEGNAPRPSLGDTKGVFSSRREYPLCLAAAQRAALFMQRQRRCNHPSPAREIKRENLFEKRIPPLPGSGAQRRTIHAAPAALQPPSPARGRKSPSPCGGKTLNPEARSCRGRRAHGSAGAARSAPPARRYWTRRGSSRCPFPW